MVATQILQQERAEALARLRDTLASLQGSDASAVEQATERSPNNVMGQDYQAVMFLGQVVQVLEHQPSRISELEKQAAPAKSRSEQRDMARTGPRAACSTPLLASRILHSLASRSSAGEASAGSS